MNCYRIEYRTIHNNSYWDIIIAESEKAALQQLSEIAPDADLTTATIYPRNASDGNRLFNMCAPRDPDTYYDSCFANNETEASKFFKSLYDFDFSVSEYIREV